MRVYTLQEYADEVSHCSLRTVKRRIAINMLPTNHFLKRGGRENMIVVCGYHEYKASEYFDACCEFHQRRGRTKGTLELATEIAVKYDILLTKFCKILGI